MTEGMAPRNLEGGLNQPTGRGFFRRVFGRLFLFGGGKGGLDLSCVAKIEELNRKTGKTGVPLGASGAIVGGQEL